MDLFSLRVLWVLTLELLRVTIATLLILGGGLGLGGSLV